MTTARLRGEAGRWQVERQEAQVQACAVELGEGERLRLIQIPAGEFLMGSSANEPMRRDDEGPQHRVRLASFLMGQTPVTQAQWRVVAGWPKLELDLSANPSRFTGPNKPVELVSWNEAMEFCHRLSQRSGFSISLPSEAQWEYACRAGTTTAFAFGDWISSDLAHYVGFDGSEDGPTGQRRSETTDVATFPANALGLYDMHGNVWEWCLDHWHNSYVGAPADGSAWLDGKDIKSVDSSKYRLQRGGSWLNSPEFCRSASRLFAQRSAANLDVGLRIACLPQGPSINP